MTTWNYERPTRGQYSGTTPVKAGQGIVLVNGQWEKSSIGGECTGVALSDAEHGGMLDVCTEKHVTVPLRASTTFGVGAELTVTADGWGIAGADLTLAISQGKATVAGQIVKGVLIANIPRPPALTGLKAAMTATTGATYDDSTNTLTFASLAASTAGAELTITAAPSGAVLPTLTATSADVTTATATVSGDKVNITPLLVDATGTKVTIDGRGKTLQITVITSAA